MEKDKFKKAKELSDRIAITSNKIIAVNKLLEAKTLSCEIKGPSYDYTIRSHYNENQALLRQILEADKALLERELHNLTTEFESI